MEDRCLKRKKEASGIVIFVTEELGDARLRCNQLKDYVNEAVQLIEKSGNREHFFEVAGHLLHGIPDTLVRLEKALGAAAMAVSKWDYEEIKEDLRPEKSEQLEDALKDVRTRRVERRSANTELTPMKTRQAAEDLTRIAESIDQTGQVDTEALMTLIASLESNEKRIASSDGEVAKLLRELAASLNSGESRPSRSLLASALRRVLGETLKVGGPLPPPLPEPGFAPYSLPEGFEFIRNGAIAAYRRGSTGHQYRQAFDQLASIISEIGLMCESIGSTDVPALAVRMSKAVRLSRSLLKPDMVESLRAVASDKTAANLAVTQMLKSFAEGSKFGDFDVGDVRGAADRLEKAAMKAAKLAFQYHLDTPPTNLFAEIAGCAHDLAFYMGAAVAEPASAEVDLPLSKSMASEKTAGSPTLTQMVNAFREGAQFGGYEMRDVRGAAMRVGAAAQTAAKYAQQPNALSTRMPIHVLTELAERLYDLAFYMGSASAALAKTARFEEGESSDPTENMSDDDAEKWKTEHDDHKDKFKAAAESSETEDADDAKEAGTKAKSLVPRINKHKKYAEDDKLSRFEEGKPADPTDGMDADDAAKWKENTDKYEDKFKAASVSD